VKKVCILETESHYEVVRNFVLSITGQAEIVIVTNTYCAENLTTIQHPTIRIVNYQIEEAIATNLLQSEAFNLKVATTPPSWSFYKQHSDWFKDAELVIHNMNYWLEPHSNVYFLKKLAQFPLKSLWRYLKNYPEMCRKRKQFKHNFRNYLAPSKELFENYRKHRELKGYIELKINRWMPKDNLGKVVQIVIPGTVNRFRDYDKVISILNNIAKTSEKKINLVLLGKNSDRRNFQNQENNKLTITTFNKMLNDREYVKYLRTSDFGILPLRKEVENQGILEVKGFSNISGGINDFYYVGLRGLVPEFYMLKDADTIISYKNDNDLKEQIARLLRRKPTQTKDMNLQNAFVSSHNQRLLNDAI
jgi:hypothetical protein